MWKTVLLKVTFKRIIHLNSFIQLKSALVLGRPYLPEALLNIQCTLKYCTLYSHLSSFYTIQYMTLQILSNCAS